MPPIRADHGLSWRKGSPHAVAAGAGGDGEERAKQSRRSIPLTKRHSPSHSRTPSPNQQVSGSTMATIHATTHGHVFAHGSTRRSPSSKTGNTGNSTRSAFPDGSGAGAREKRRASPDPTRKGYLHAHSAQRGLGSKSPAFAPPFKGCSTRGVGATSRSVSSPTPAVGGGRANSSPTPLAGGNGRGHSPTLPRGVSNSDIATVDPPTQVSAPALALPIPPAISGASASLSLAQALGAAEAREMTPLDRVFLEQPHQGRKDVEGDELHLCNEIQRHLQSRVQSQQSQLQLEAATIRNNSTSAAVGSVGGTAGVLVGAMGSSGSSSVGGGTMGLVLGRGGGSGGSGSRMRASHGVPGSFVSEEMELINDDDSCYSLDPGLDDPETTDPDSSFVSVQSSSRRTSSGGGGSSSSGGGSGGGGGQPPSGAGGYPSPVSLALVGGADLLDNPDLGSVGVMPVSPSSAGGPAQGLVLDVVGPMDYLLEGTTDPRGGTRDARAGPVSRSPTGTTDVQMGEGGGDGQLREVVSGLEGMDLDEVDRALALLTAQKERIIAKQSAAHAEAQQAQAAIVPPQPPPPPPQSQQQQPNYHGGSLSSRNGGSGKQRRSSGRSKHSGGESSPSAGGRSEAFGLSGGGVRAGPPSSFSRVARGQGRPPPVPGHLLASTAAMRRSSPGSIASLAELESYLEHHHRRLVEQVEGGVVADDVEAEIKASRQPRRGTRSHQRFGSGGSSSSSNSVPRTVGARVSTGPFFHSTLSNNANGYEDAHRETTQEDCWNNGNSARSGGGSRGGYKRDRGELRGGGADGGWGANLRGFRGGEVDEDGDRDRGSAFLTVPPATSHSQTSSPPPSIMSSLDDVSVSSYGHHPITVLPGSPNNLTFAGRPPPSLTKKRLEVVRSPVVRHGRREQGRGMDDSGGSAGGSGGSGGGGLVFTSPDASKHVQELCSPRSAFTPRSVSSVSSRASSPARRR